MNTLHVRRNPTAGPADAAFLVALLSDTNTDALVTGFRAMMSTGQTLQRIWARQAFDPLNPTDARAEATRTLNLAGTRTVTNGDLPIPLCGILSLGTDTAGRRYHGRIFLPPVLNTTDLSNTLFNTGGTYWTGIDTFVTQLNKTMYPSGAGHYGGSWNDSDLAIYSRRARSLDVGPYYARVTGASKKNQPSFLRSRRSRT